MAQLFVIDGDVGAEVKLKPIVINAPEYQIEIKYEIIKTMFFSSKKNVKGYIKIRIVCIWSAGPSTIAEMRNEQLI